MAVEEGGEFGEAEGEAFGGGGAEGEVAEFAAGAGGFAVEMEVGVGDGEDFGGVGGGRRRTTNRPPQKAAVTRAGLISPRRAIRLTHERWGYRFVAR